MGNRQYRNEGVFKANAAQWLYPWNTYYYDNMCITGQKVKPRLLIEKRLGEGKTVPARYEIYCVHGEPWTALVPCGRKNNRQRSGFMMIDTWQGAPFRRHDVDKISKAEKPAQLEEMLTVSRKLAGDLPFAAVEFLLVDGRLYVNGINCDPGLFQRIEPVEWDFRLGSVIDLDKVDPSRLRDEA